MTPYRSTIALLASLFILAGCQSAPLPSAGPGQTTTIGDTTITTSGRVRIEGGYAR